MTHTKKKIIDAAVTLFNTKGYNGTSVRDIAKQADVNAANISYYFSGKKGLLEYLITSFLEGYIQVLGKVFASENVSPKEMLLAMVRDILHYQSNHRELTRFFYRELSLDSMLIREVMTTYLVREKYYLQTIIHKGMQQGEFKKVSFPVFMVQLKGMLQSPYLHTQYISEVLYSFPTEAYFADRYAKEVESWLVHTLYRPVTAALPAAAHF